MAAQWLRDHRARTVAVVDLDGRHGNGTQEIFYERADVYVASVHADPGQGCFPHFTGFYHERGAATGEASTATRAAAGRRRPGVDRRRDGDRAEVRAFGPDVLVVSLGVDAAVEDPANPLAVTAAAFAEAARLLESLDVPTLFVQEGASTRRRRPPHRRRLGAFEEATAG